MHDSRTVKVPIIVHCLDLTRSPIYVALSGGDCGPDALFAVLQPIDAMKQETMNAIESAHVELQQRMQGTGGNVQVTSGVHTWGAAPSQAAAPAVQVRSLATSLLRAA